MIRIMCEKCHKAISITRALHSAEAALKGPSTWYPKTALPSASSRSSSKKKKKKTLRAAMMQPCTHLATTAVVRIRGPGRMAHEQMRCTTHMPGTRWRKTTRPFTACRTARQLCSNRTRRCRSRCPRGCTATQAPALPHRSTTGLTESSYRRWHRQQTPRPTRRSQQRRRRDHNQGQGQHRDRRRCRRCPAVLQGA